MIIPTGVRAEIGGHAGDANPVANLLASCCDTLITHPNVVNGSDLNEMAENIWYVEGSILDRFLSGDIELEPTYGNKILVAVNKPAMPHIINSVSAARMVLGADIEIIELDKPLWMEGSIQMSGKADGRVTGWRELVTQVGKYQFDALAINTPIRIDRDTKFHYFKHGGTNPWGRVEAMASKLIAASLNKPVAHSPSEDWNWVMKHDPELFALDFTVDPKIAPEMVSVSFLHCILKGLHRAPRIGKGLSNADVTCVFLPHGCAGTPAQICDKREIPLYIIDDNKTCLDNLAPKASHIKSYLEAAGVLQSYRAGIDWRYTKRPIIPTKVFS